MFEQIQGSIIINFIVKLSKFRDPINNTSYNSIFVIINRFIKYSKFILANESYSTKDLTGIVIRKIISNYRLLDEFVIDKNTTFVFRFFIIFTAKFGMNSKLSIAFHLQMNRKIKQFNQTIEQYLKYYINYNQNDWIRYLSIIQFVYNISIYKTIK